MWLNLLPRQLFCDYFSKMCYTKSETIFVCRKTCSPLFLYTTLFRSHYLPILCGFEVSEGVKIGGKIATFCDKKIFQLKSCLFKIGRASCREKVYLSCFPLKKAEI